MKGNGGDKPGDRVELKAIPLGFLILILVGAFALWLPYSRPSGQGLSLLDALFMATSATCVTGLATVNPATHFNPYGQGVLLFLIQLGGLGILTAGTLMTLLSGRRLSLAGEISIQASFGKLPSARPLALFWYACLFVLVIEAAGAGCLYPLLRAADQAASRARSSGRPCFIRSAPSATPGSRPSPMAWRTGGPIPRSSRSSRRSSSRGGIGLISLVNLRYYRPWRRDPRRRGQLTLQTKLSVVTTLFLLVGGMWLVIVCDLGHTLANVAWPDRLSWALFHSTMSRTAGFNVVDLEAMHPATLLGTMFLMFVGGGPGSMAGGIKTVTFALLVVTAAAALRRREGLHLFHRDVPGH